jgi:hypothetical protein
MEALFNFQIARVMALAIGVNGVEVRGIDDVDFNASMASSVNS